MNTALDYCSAALRKAGVDKFQCVLTETTQNELNLDGPEITLLRTTKNNALAITVIKDQRKGDISLNSVDPQSIDEAIRTVLELSQASLPDPDYDISPQAAPEQFVAGPQAADTERMYQLLKDFSRQLPLVFPEVITQSILDHSQGVQRFVNSNGVDFVTTQGVYNFTCMFSARAGEKTASFNYTGFSLQELERELLDSASLRRLLQQSVEQLDARPLRGKFVGDLVITPDCLGDLISQYVGTYLGDQALISGTSPLKEKLEQPVASEQFTLSSQPVSPEIADGYFVTPDGFAAENVTLVERGVLKSFLLSLYGSNKTKLARAKSAGGCFVVEPGHQTLDQIISQVERGILVARYSGGNPSSNGDFSGVAKNSYYIENGQLLYPINETMISGNLAELFANIKSISSERTDFGFAVLPYVQSGGVTISGRDE